MSDPQTPKIIVDDDWKSQARAEKERLAKEAPPKAAPKAAPGAGDAPDPNEPLGFLDLVRMLATQALMYLGAFPDPQSGRAIVALDVAKLHIDLLSVLEAKTAGNLTADEADALTGTVHELRMQFVEVSRLVAKAAEEGKLRPQMGPQGGPLGGPGSPPPGGTRPLR